ncbi:hypothetical protein ABZ383_31720 [Streptomyces sp. NPDC005900]|uniref:hypothetical protein n=1 Tax=Streptomyces sp. NPDC005900 TaxID=3154569 RepID=UPI0033EECBA0
MVSKSKPPIVVLHDLEDVRSEINATLETACENQRPGLQAALDILNRRATATDDQRVREWVRRTVSEAGVEIDEDHVRAVKALRDAVPGLGLIAANDLVKSALPH